jgi:O-antigen/teichoic acid export membrane protein
MNRIRQMLIDSEFNNVAILSGGVLISQAISSLAQPFATRLYLPQEFGIVAIIVSLVSMFSGVLNGQYDLCIVTAKTNKEANSVTALSLYIGLALSFLVSIGIIVFNIINPGVLKDAGAWIYVSIPLLILSGIVNVLNSYNNRYKQYKLLASVSMYRAIAANGVKVGFGFAKIGVIGLILSALVSNIVGLRSQSKQLRANFKEVLSTNKKELKGVLVKFKAQPMFSAPGLFVVSYSYSIIPLFISALYGLKEVGFYSLAMGMLGLPISLIGTNVGKVFFRKASLEKAETGCFYQSFKSSLIILTVLSIIPFVILWLFAEPMFSFVFGHMWFRSGTFVRMLVPWYWMNFIVGSLVIGLIISGKQLLKLSVQCLFVVEAFIIYIVVKKMTLNIETFLLTLSCFYGMTYLLLLYFIYKTSVTRETLIIDETGKV